MAGDLTTIFDDEVPLAPLPKTGEPIGSNGPVAMLTAMLLGAYLFILKRKEEEAE